MKPLPVLLVLALAAAGLKAETPAPTPAPTHAPALLPWQLSPEERLRIQQQTDADHADMLRQLGIRALRPGRSGSTAPGTPNPANYDESLANPTPDWPDALVERDGAPVRTPAEWWSKRRPEIAEDFEREVVGRIPGDVPRVTWSVVRRLDTTVGGLPVHASQVIGHVDNAAFPALSVDIEISVVLPAGADKPVPVLESFGWGRMPDQPIPRFPGLVDPPAPPVPDQLIAAGWGYASINTSSIQADNGAGLTSGIIGLTNKGARRTPEQWGCLRAWAWGASRTLDYLETLPSVDSKRVGIEGVSRYGKAALVAMAFDPRFAVVLVGSSGEGGAKPHRRNFGESVENLTSSGEYHWMAGNFLKYGASDSVFGAKTAADIPVDAHELIALCAPRPTFISYGIPEKGDAKWLDQRGSFMATVAAGKVFRLLCGAGAGVGGDPATAVMPPVNTGLLQGALAWRQHDGGHEDRSNLSSFLEWADRMLGYQGIERPADLPVMRHDRNSHLAHYQLVEKAKAGGISVYFLGDSITRRWGATDYPDYLRNWTANFHGWNAADFGWGGDTTQNILWRIQNGELDGVNPKVIVLLAGTNNVGKTPGPGKIEDVTAGIAAILRVCREKAPGATVILMAIFPRNDASVGAVIEGINARIRGFADGKAVRFLDINGKLADPDGTLHAGLTTDELHLSAAGYQIWADALKPILGGLLGPPAATDTAPPPTGDPRARKAP